MLSLEIFFFSGDNLFWIFLAPLRWSQSLSKDTGLGSTSQTNDTPMSYLDLMHSQTLEQTSGNI